MAFAAVVLLLLMSLAAAPIAKPSCDVRVAAGAHLAAAIASAPAGARLCLAAGEHAGGVVIDKSVTLIGEAGAVLVGTGRGSNVRIDGDGLAVRIENIEVRGGTAEAGGGLALFGRSSVHIAGCTFRGGNAGMVGGGGLYARAGLLHVEETTFDSNSGKQGGAIMADQAAKAEFKRCTFANNRSPFGGAVRVSEAAAVQFKACKFTGNRGDDGSAVRISGTKSRKPQVQFEFCTVDVGSLVNGPEIAGDVTAKGCTLPASWKSPALRDLGQNKFTSF